MKDNKIENKKRYLIFYKPFGVLSQFTPEDGHPALNSFGLPPEVYPAGRLDHDSEGLLLLTNDGPLIAQLLDPKNQKKKTYFVQVDGAPSEESLQKLSSGLKIKNYQTLPCEVEIIPPPPLPPRNPPIRYRAHIPTTWLKMIILEGKNRQIRHMTAAIGHPTLRLVRIKIEKIELKNLEPGQWLEINRHDIV